MKRNFLHDQADLIGGGQIRLAELSVFNWGSFHGLHTAHIDGHGTLITGDNGAGKSTLIDGLMALLLPAGSASFNIAAAQGDRTDRSLVSYIRGSYGTAHDGSQTLTRNKRSGGTVSALRACYRADDGAEITLAALFWMTQPSNALADLKRVYVVAKRNLQLEEMLQAFGEGNARALKQFLRDDERLISCDDNFTAYQETYRQLLHMENSNAPALLSRALGLKKIDDLTRLIRELVLEPSRVREDARKTVAEFGDLEGVHDRLLDARAQRDTLAALPEAAAALQQARQDIARLDAEHDGLPVYVGEQCHALWGKRIETIKQQLGDAEMQLKHVEQQAHSANERVERLHADYLRVGGNRIEDLKKDVQRTKERLAEINKHAARYQTIARELDLDAAINEKVFNANLDTQRTAVTHIEGEIEQAQNDFADTAARYSQTLQRQKALDTEIREIEARPDSNIDVPFQQLRDQMCDALQLDAEQILFIGELIDIKPDCREWQGAVERALGGLRTTMAVPEARYPLITRWLNQRHTGLHVRVQIVGRVSGTAEFKHDGYLRKLQWRDHPYREWLKRHLQRFDLHCVSSTEDLDRTPFSLTQQGLIHFDKGRFEKKDRQRIDDKRQWQLGFSNTLRLHTLRQEAGQLASDINLLEQETKQRRESMNKVERRAQQWQQLAGFQWPDIDVPHWQARLHSQHSDLDALQQSGGDLEQAQRRWQAAKRDLEQLHQKIAVQNKMIAGYEKELELAQAARNKAWQAASAGLDDAVRKVLNKRVGELRLDNLEQAQDLEGRHRDDIERHRNTAGNRKTQASNQAVAIMSTFYSRDSWEAIAADWGRSIESIDDYLLHLQKLEKEGLPSLVEKFKQRLNKHTTYSLAGIKSRMDAEREEISERIETINRVLVRTEFRPGTHLRLDMKTEQYPHVQDFNRRLIHVFAQAGSDDHEQRFRDLQAVIAILDKASDSVTAHNKESLRLLDPRYQLSFYAEEIDAQSREVRDVLMSSSGKSGGEKESFAGTIVAASLAYVLTPDGADMPIYSTVFLDEAFSNTAEAVSRRVLRVFKELNIHINLITPFKNLNLARESARSLLIAERDANTHESRLCEVTWEELDEIRAARERQTRTHASELGIELEHVS
ncbi:MAG: ATP-binding protein [Gammaproteobacteria bacterium]|jgi:uncharacterized protein YPO0396